MTRPPQEYDNETNEPRVLPFPNWWPLIVGALVGVAFRLIFTGDAGNAFAAMNGAFIYFVPIAVGAITVYVAELKEKRTWLYYAFAPMAANSLFVVGTLVILIEGLICIIIVLPLFCMLGAIGGLMMGAICRVAKRRKGVVCSFAALPLLL
ncbi:MAG TPA: SRPBCC domain-containing protein, partial [Burkholderiaceae bacterium]